MIDYLPSEKEIEIIIHNCPSIQKVFSEWTQNKPNGKEIAEAISKRIGK